MQFQFQIARLALALAAVALVPAAQAQAWPARPVRIVVPFAPGGGTDILARLMASKLGDRWNQSVVVENKAGCDGIIGTDLVAKSRPDGYNLAFVTPSHVINPSVKASLPYNTLKDFAAITMIASTPFVAVIGNGVAARNVREFVTYAKAQPQALAFGSSDPSSRLAGELFKSLAGIDMLNVPYKGGAQTFTDVAGGHLPAGFASLMTVLPFQRGGTVRVLGVSGATRSPLMPDVPTLAEAGLAGYDASAWYGLVAPVGIAAEIPARIHQDVVQITRQPDVQENLLKVGATAVASSPEVFTAFIANEVARSAQLVRNAGIKPE